MKRIIWNLILIFTIHGIFSTVAATQYESCSLNRQMKALCSSYTYTIVRPMLDYYRQVSDDLQQSHAKDKLIRDLREKLVRQEGNEALIKQLQSQINFQMKIITEKNEEITKMRSESDFQVEDHKKQILKKDKDLQLCQIEVEKLNKLQPQTDFQKQTIDKLTIIQFQVDKLKRTALDNIPSSCIPFGENPGIHQIKVSDLEPFDVLCDSQLAGPGWLVMQQRIGGSEDFLRNWSTYRDGFGSLSSDFFLGLEKIHRLTNSQRYELYIHLVVLNGTTYYARYDDFKISDGENRYALSLGKFEGNAGDAMRYAEHKKFSTFDRANDHNSCALAYGSGWWYVNCYNGNLNAIYGAELNWFKSNPLQKAKMLIRPKV